MISSDSSLKIGTILDKGEWRYRIVDILGQGGFGITYLAIGEVKVGNVTTEAKFAIKEHFPGSFCYRQGQVVIPKDDKSADYERSKSDFISEAKKLHSLGAENENIVKVNEVFEENQTAYYVMQYINGVSLTDYVKSKKKLSHHEALSLLLPIFNAVDFLHKSRINHLDIKPDNIMLHDSIDGKVPVLIDFGLSVHFKKNGDKTSPKGVMGVSEGYSPLEQYAGIKEFNPAADIYALAATMLYALTGITPKGASDLKLSEVRTTMAKLAPQQTIDALCKALNKSYEDRTSSVNAFKSDLGVVAADGQVTEPIDPIDPRKKKLFKIMALLLCVLAIAVACFIYLRPTSEGVTHPGPKPEIDTISEPFPTPVPDPDTIPDTKPTPLPPAPAPEPTPAPEPVVPKPVVTKGTLSLGYATWNGGIKNGKPDGKGRLTFTSTHVVDRQSSVEANSGDYFDATYDNGSLISGKLYDSDGNLLKTIIP